MKVAAIVHDSTIDGPGLRMTVALQKRHLCQENNTVDPSIDDIVEEFQQNLEVDGITLSGDDPFDQALDCARLAIAIKHLNPKYTVWTFTSSTYEEILQSECFECELLLDMTDVLVDGPFIQSLQSDEYQFRVSSNQRLIDVKRSKAENTIRLYRSLER